MSRNSKHAKTAAIILIFMLVFLQFSPAALAVSYDISGGTITISDNDSYTIFGMSSGAEVVVVTGGQPVITIDNLTIPADSAPAIDIQGGDVTLIIEGINTLGGGVGAGNVGLAGIRVAQGATLTISGNSTGSVTVNGGNGTNAAAGAGIGSNGEEPAFGTIIINGGDITATGGRPMPSSNVENTAGAGIGTGGTTDEDLVYEGIIEINGGIIYATGGYGNAYVINSLGGAGIGSGSNGHGAGSFIETAITGGTVTARGGLDAAGIGGGSNIPSGPIFIGGTSIVRSLGFSSGGSFGGAGIGGGDNGYTQGITITGDSIVLAIGYGAAAGIGGGFSQGNWGGVPGNDYSYTISGNAFVVAVGGSTATSGGAGIGSGYLQYNSSSMGGVINILDNAEVEAYGGTNANAIGNGRITASNPTNDPVDITIANTAVIRAFTANEAEPALHPNNTIEPPAVLYSYTGAPASEGVATDITTPPAMSLTWEWASGISPGIDISNGISFNANGDFRPVIYNWAYIFAEQELLVPQIISANTTTFTQNSPGSFQVVATNDPTSFALAGTLPAGVTFDTATGLLSGMPAAGTAGVYPLIITASNDAGTSEPQEFTLVVLATYTITAAAGSHGTITPTGAVDIPAGDNATFIIAPDKGYMIDTLLVDGQAVAPTNIYTFTNVQANHTISVTFKRMHTPKTGDDGFAQWPVILAVSAAAGAGIAVYNKLKGRRKSES